MHRFLLRPAWIGFHLLVIAAVVLMVNLGMWQLRRLDERRDFNAVVQERSELAPTDVSQLIRPGVDAPDVEWRTVTATGTYLGDEQLVVVNRGQAGQAGVNVVTPLRLADGRVLIVNRGFVPGPAAAPAPPAGSVTVEGRVRASQRRGVGQLSDPATGELTEVQRIDVARIAQQLPGEVLPVYVDLLRADPPQGAVPIPLPDPELDEGPHLSYAIQWFIFSVAVVVGWVLAVRRSAARHRSHHDAGGQPQPGGDDRSPAAGASPTTTR